MAANQSLNDDMLAAQDRLAAHDRENEVVSANIQNLSVAVEQAATAGLELEQQVHSLRWWVRSLAFAVTVLLLVVFFSLLSGCGGAPFEMDRPVDGELAGAAGAVSLPVAGSLNSSGGAGESGQPPFSLGGSAVGVAGAALGGGSAGDPGDVLAGAGVGGEPLPELEPCKREWLAPTVSNWRFSAVEPIPIGTDGRAAVADGDLATEWATSSPQAPGMWFELSFTEPLTVAALELREQPGNAGVYLPTSLRVSIAGKSTPATFDQDAGDDVLHVSFPATATKGPIRLELVTPALQPWAIAELGAFCK